MVMCFEKIEGTKNSVNTLTKCVDVQILRLCKASICMVQIENEILYQCTSGKLLGYGV